MKLLVLLFAICGSFLVEAQATKLPNLICRLDSLYVISQGSGYRFTHVSHNREHPQHPYNNVEVKMMKRDHLYLMRFFGNPEVQGRGGDLLTRTNDIIRNDENVLIIENTFGIYNWGTLKVDLVSGLATFNLKKPHSSRVGVWSIEEWKMSGCREN